MSETPDSPLTRRRLLGLALAAGTAPAFVRHARAADVERFALGIASGHPTATGLVLWTRLTGADLPPEVPVRWTLADDEGFTRIVAQGEHTARSAWAHSVHAEPAGLEPARWYWYRFEALGQRSAIGRTRTAPVADAKVDALSFVIASCQRWDVGHYAAWRHAAAEAPDLVFFLGDYIYEYASPNTALRLHAGPNVKTLDGYRERYAQYKSDVLLQAAHAACPWLVIWDDHEVENDYAGLQGQTLQPDFSARRAAAYQAWWEHMPVPMAARPVGPDMRIYNRLDWGRLARFHLLDDRQYRDPQACPKPGRGGSNTVPLKDCESLLDPRRTLLGAAQERWLGEGWRLDSPWNLLAQQTLMARFAWKDPKSEAGASYWTDGWDGYPASRQRLLSTLAERQVKGAVVLGGDVHANYVADVHAEVDDPRSPVLASEFCGTSITSLSTSQARMDAALSFNPHVHWARGDRRGYVHFRLDNDHLQARLRVLDDARDPGSAIGTAASFHVAAGRPGIERA